MSFTSIALVAVGIIAGISMVSLLSLLKLKKLRTVPSPAPLAPESINHFSADTRAGIKLHQACYDNDAWAASEAFTMWAWAKGEPTIANAVDQKTTDLQSLALRQAITELWVHLDPKNEDQWFGHKLWSAFMHSYPEYQESEFMG